MRRGGSLLALDRTQVYFGRKNSETLCGVCADMCRVLWAFQLDEVRSWTPVLDNLPSEEGRLAVDMLFIYIIYETLVPKATYREAADRYGLMFEW